MPMDALCLSAVCREVEPAVLGGRIDKIYQPSRDEILLQIRGRAGSCRLLLSANPSRPRLQLTDLPRENPAEPPMFCMLLRKYLAGGKILALRQPPMERLVELVVEATNEMGDKVRRRLVLEAMGRRTNLLLLDGEDRIVDCLRRVEGDLTQARPLLPGMFYQYPAPQPGKKNPGALTPADRAELLALGQGAGPADRFLLDHCMGLSPLLARELAFEAFGEVDAPVSRDPAALLDRLDRGRLCPPCWSGRASRWISPSGPSSSTAPARRAGPIPPLPPSWTPFTRPGRPPTRCARRGRISSNPSPRPGSGWPGRWPSRRRSWPPQATGTGTGCTGTLSPPTSTAWRRGPGCCGRKTITTLTAARWRSRWTP